MPLHLSKAEKLIESCEHCNPDGAEIPFDNILDRITGSDPSVTDYIPIGDSLPDDRTRFDCSAQGKLRAEEKNVLDTVEDRYTVMVATLGGGELLDALAADRGPQDYPATMRDC